MQRRSWLKLTTLFPLLSLAALPVITTAQDSSQPSGGDPVADAARHSREAKQTAAKTRKVYTNDDLPQHKDTTPAPTTTSPTTVDTLTTTSPDTATKATSTPDQEKDQETLWRKRFQAQRDKIARAEKELDILQRETQKAQIQYYPDPQKTMNEQYTRKDINEKDAKIAAKRQEVAQLKQGLSDLEDELRKAGGDSGWARE